jgi:endonuclease YncB( thermonuclease family)
MRDSSCADATFRILPAVALACGLLAGWTYAVSARGDGRDGEAQGALTGLARVVDGDTIVVNDVRVRLEGIDAPEAGQTCTRPPAGAWPCGQEATNALVRLIGGKLVSCQSRGLDKYGRTLGVCFLERDEVNAWMVREGHAWAFTRYSTSHVEEEAEARARRVGIWQGEAIPAWEYRAQKWAKAEPEAPQGCAIKGNVTQHGKDLSHAVEPLVRTDQDGPR